MHPQFNNTPNYALIGLKLCFYNLLRNTELARVAYVMMALAKTIYILMIEVKKLFIFAFHHSARVPTGFLILPRFHLRFYNLTGNMEDMFSIS